MILRCREDIASRFSFGRMGDLCKRLRLPFLPQLPHRRKFVAPISSGPTKTACLGSLLILLQGCVTTQPEAVKVYIKVPTPCIQKTDLPKPADVKPDAELAKLDDAKLILTIAAERLDLKRYATESSALLGACVE